MLIITAVARDENTGEMVWMKHFNENEGAKAHQELTKYLRSESGEYLRRGIHNYRYRNENGTIIEGDVYIMEMEAN